MQPVRTFEEWVGVAVARSPAIFSIVRPRCRECQPTRLTTIRLRAERTSEARLVQEHGFDVGAGASGDEVADLRYHQVGCDKCRQRPCEPSGTTLVVGIIDKSGRH